MFGWTQKAGARALTPALAVTLAVALAMPMTASGESTESWKQWGGPEHDFRAPAAGLAASWGEHGPKQLWSRELGDGYSTILVEDGKLYTMYRVDDQEAVICMDAATGKTVWEHRYDHDPHEGHVTQFGSGPRATPLLAGERIYTVGVAGKMLALAKADGKVAWSHDLWGEDFGGNKLEHGYSSSPVEHGDTVIALIGGEGKSIAAFHKGDGSVAWQGMSYKNSYSSPQILEVDGQEQLVAFMAKELVGVDPATGEELWRYPQENQAEQNINLPTLIDGKFLFLSSLQAGARGLKLTVGEDGKTNVEELWSSRKIQFYHVSSVHDGDWIYGSSGARAPAFMSAVNVKTGEIPWRERGIGKANSVYADGRVIVLDEDGKLYLTTATPEGFTIHSQVQLLDRVAWSAPTIVGKNMYVRDKVRIMALDLSASQPAEAVISSEGFESGSLASEKVVEAAEGAAEATEKAAEAAEMVAAAAPEDSEAVKILKRVDAAIKKVKGVRYTATAVPSGIAVNFVSAAEGEGLMVGWSGQAPEKFFGRVKTTRPGSGEAMEVSGGSDGETFFLIDHQGKKAYADMDPSVMGSGAQALGTIRMAEFVHPTPFDDEIHADSVELQGKETVAGVECHKIHVVYSGGVGASTWYFGTQDLMPRRRVRHFTVPQQGEGTLDVTLTELTIDPEVDPAKFAFRLPEGYQQIDDFAP